MENDTTETMEKIEDVGESEREFLKMAQTAVSVAVSGNTSPLVDLLLEMRREISSKADRKDFHRYQKPVYFDSYTSDN